VMDYTGTMEHSVQAGKRYPIGSRAGLRSDPLLGLLERVHGSLYLDLLAGRYIDGVSRIIEAEAYALYIFDPETRRPTRLAQTGGVEPFVTRYEQIGFAYDPILAYIDQTLEPAHDALFFSPEDWQGQQLRTALSVRRLMRLLISPVVSEEERIGSIFFTRRPDQPSFSEQDLAVAGALGRHLGVAIRNALLLHEAGKRVKTAEGVLEVMGSALVLTDRQGNVRFVNRAADRLLRAPSLPPDLFRQSLGANLLTLSSGRREAVSRIDVGRTERRLVLRSRRLPEIDGRVATFLHHEGSDRSGPQFDHLLGLLSPRELEVLGLVTQGLQNKEIAARLSLSPNTVQYHLKRLFALLEVRSRSGLLARALGSQLAEDPDRVAATED